MPQLAGAQCVICQKTISGVLSAKFCERCGNPVHNDCLAEEREKVSAPDRCDVCGGDPATAPRDRPIKAFNPVPLLLTVAVLVVAVLIYSVWPTSEGNIATAGDSLALAQDNKDSVKKEDLPVVEIETTEGTIKVRLFTDKAPNTAQNFIDLVKQKYYDGIIFHRVIPQFMIQTGDPTGTGRGGRTDKGLPPKHLKDEFHPDLKHDRPGILSMANRGPDTGDSQFFITTVPTPHLDNRHAVFGEVIEGMDVVKKIENTPTGAQDRPLNPPKMTKVRLVEAEE